MLATRPPLAASAIAALVLGGIAAASARSPREPDAWCAGTIEHGSLARAHGRYHMRLRVAACSEAMRDVRELDLEYSGALPRGVCSGTFVFALGAGHGDRLDASELEAVHEGRYDGCLGEVCLPEPKRSERCRTRFR